MNNNLSTAAKLLKSEDFTLVVISDRLKLTSRQRGVKPLLELTVNNASLSGCSVADKVIGKAAALLYVLLKPEEIFTFTISRPALDVLTQNHINVKYDTLTRAIQNRDKSGFCPMETAVLDVNDPKEALVLIKKRLSELNNSASSQ